VQNETRVAFCRCGASKNKHFCDKSHGEAGFVDTGEIGDGRLVPAEQSSPDAPVVFKSAPSGPLLVSGPLTSKSAEEAQSCSGARGALCRCGASKKKPFCDGAHAAIGFEAD
jgi:CDGSH-type Zn-finger protein